MDAQLLRATMVRYGDTQKTLAVAMGITRPALNAKLKERNGREFTQSEIAFIRTRYALSAEEVDTIFFAKLVS